MRLRNSKGRERNFKLILKLEKENNTYIVYQDINTGNYYAGKKKGKKLLIIDDDEKNYIDKYLERISG